MLKTIWYNMFCYGKFWKGTHDWVVSEKSPYGEFMNEYRCKKCKRKRLW